jgi:heat shock protein HtpX
MAQNIYTNQSSNVAKTWLLMGVFLAVVVAIGYFLSQIYGNPGILYVAIIFSVFMNILSYWYSDSISLSLAGAKPASREEYFNFYTVAENMAITAGLPLPKLYVIDDQVPNAFATGRNKNHAAVAVTTGLLERLDRRELEGVIAHEMSHIGNRDTLLMTAVVVLVGFISIISDIFIRSRWLGGSRRNNDGEGGGILAIIGIVFIIISPIIATLIQLAISRKREFLADSSGALLTRYPEGLASALEKIALYSAPMRNARTATAHLFISNPFGAREDKSSWLSNLFLTHPPVEERIKVLKSFTSLS